MRLNLVEHEGLEFSAGFNNRIEAPNNQLRRVLNVIHCRRCSRVVSRNRLFCAECEDLVRAEPMERFFIATTVATRFGEIEPQYGNVVALPWAVLKVQPPRFVQGAQGWHFYFGRQFDQMERAEGEALAYNQRVDYFVRDILASRDRVKMIRFSDRNVYQRATA